MQKVAFELGPFTVTWYGIFVAAAFWFGTWTAARRAPRAGIQGEAIWDLLWVLIVAGIIGARALYVATYWKRDFARGPWSEILMVHHGGLVFHGGFILATLAGFAYAMWRKLPAWRLLDIFAPSVALGHAIGRLGCFVNGCCYGRRTELPWAIQYPYGYEAHGAGVHPTQIYETLLCVGLYFGLEALFRRRRFDGQVFAVYLLSYAFIRSIVELLRGDYPPDVVQFGVLTPAHWVSAGLFVLGLALYMFRRGYLSVRSAR